MTTKRVHALVIILFVIVLGIIGRVSAQDVEYPKDLPIVCQDVNYGVGSFVIHIPASWNAPELPSWTVLADGFGALQDPPNMIDWRADWLTNWTDIYGEGFPEWEQNIKNGQVIVTAGDYSVIVVADASTPACDDNGYPVVPEPTPAPTDEPTGDQQCTVDGTGKTYCYSTQGLPQNASGYVVPVPPAPQ